MIPWIWFEEAQQLLRAYIQKTPLTYDSDMGVYYKWENHQKTGSFKVRGALNKIKSLQRWEQEAGIVTASAGNHGLGVAFACHNVGAKALVFASKNAVPSKLEAMRALGAEIHLVDGGYSEAEKAGIAYAQEKQATWVSPYNDGKVIAGQGTLGLETLEQLPELEEATWLVPSGGGGLLSGIGGGLKLHPEYSHKKFAVIGVQSEASPFLHALFHTGAQDDILEKPSLADGLAGAVENGSVTIPLTKQFADDIILVSEDEIRQAIAYAWHHYQEKIEGSSAVGLAAVLSGKINARPAIIIMTGGNIQPETFQKIILGESEK